MFKVEHPELFGIFWWTYDLLELHIKDSGWPFFGFGAQLWLLAGSTPLQKWLGKVVIHTVSEMEIHPVWSCMKGVLDEATNALWRLADVLQKPCKVAQRSCSLSDETSDGKHPRGFCFKESTLDISWNEGYGAVSPSSHVGLSGWWTMIWFHFIQTHICQTVAKGKE